MIRHVFNENNFGKSILDLIDEIVSSGEHYNTAKESDVEKGYSREYNIYDCDVERHYEFAVPGFSKREIHIEIKNNKLVVIAKEMNETRNYEEQNISNYKYFEIELTPELIQGDFRTSLKDGILTVSIKPKNDKKIINID